MALTKHYSTERLIIGRGWEGDEFTAVRDPSRWMVWRVQPWRFSLRRYQDGDVVLRVGPFMALRRGWF